MLTLEYLLFRGQLAPQHCHHLAYHLPVVDILEGSGGIFESVRRVEKRIDCPLVGQDHDRCHLPG